MAVLIEPRWVAIVQLSAIAALLGAHAISLSIQFGLGYDDQMGFVRLFNVNEESNAPTWYSSTMLLVSGVLLASVWKLVREAGEPFALHWGVLSLILFFLAFDEAARVHELATPPVRALFGTGGALSAAWVIPYGIAAIGIGLAYVRFVLALPRRTAALTAAAGALYIGGALGVEMLGVHLFDWTGPLSLPMALTVLVEEMLEMLGIATFVYALVDYLARRGARIDIAFGESR